VLLRHGGGSPREGLRALTQALVASSGRDRLGRIKQTSQLGTIGLKLMASLLMD
jgi:hypothetical protein